ncbi:MAG TPA: copper resistance CopC family protein, partial [Jatrophihabitans sp.]|nr:copper resistance CopC family protein [Jatrophihabitans sp.]
MLAAILLPAAAAQAHAYLARSNPADGATLTSAPRQLRLAFSESVVLTATRVDVIGDGGHHYTPTSLRLIAGESTEDPAQVVAAIPALPRGAYRVSWQTLSADDLHTTRGVFTFGVRQAVQASPFVEPA